MKNLDPVVLERNCTAFNTWAENLRESIPETAPQLGINTCRDNVVTGARLHEIQSNTLQTLANYLALTFGPMGSNTKILTGNDDQTIMSEYSKDGHKVLKHIMFSTPIEMSIKSELVDITHHVEMEIGDGTTSAVILSSKIFDGLLDVMKKYNEVPPYKIMDAFKEVVAKIQQFILEDAHDATLDDIEDICMISTNANQEVTNNIVSIYREHGLDVDIDISISPTKESMLKVYDGLTVGVGYSDPVYINNASTGNAEIHNASVYSFMDPIDTVDMISLFEKIIMNNIIEPFSAGEETTPTVIISPKMTRDMSSLMNKFVDILHQCTPDQKPPLLVITDLGPSDEGISLDIARLCGCKYIKKYIDPEIQKMDEAEGLAANLENVVDFAGHCELVVSDIGKTKFVNPAKMFEMDEDGNRLYSKDYMGLVNFLQAELDNARANGEDDRSVATMKKRLRSLQSNLVEYFVGGISVADRDSVRDLVEDAVKNCASAIENGVGYAANFEGLLASIAVTDTYMSEYNEKADSTDYDQLLIDVSAITTQAYTATVRLLYQTVYTDTSELDDLISDTILKNCPVNLRSGEFDHKVKTSIMTDIKILEAISKIISIMVTSNQCLLQAPQLNNY